MSRRARPCSIEDCARKHFARGWCNTHYYRWRRHGDPLVTLNQHGLTPYERVMARSVQVGDCLEFTGYKRNGYGQVGAGPRVLDAPRVVMEHHHGPSLLYVLHSCDNPACVEIDHLRYGDQFDNMADMVERGRGWWQGS